jgi:hypothetical protein
MANGSQHSMAYVAEATFGTTPATPIFKPIRHKGTTLALNKDTFQSEELRSDRQITDMRHGAYDVKGDISVEFSYDSFDDMLEAAMCGTWVPTTTSTATTISSTATTLTRASGSFVTDGWAVNDVVVLANLSGALDGRYRVTAVAALTLTVTPLSGQTMAIVAGGGDETLVSLRGTLKAGTTRRSFTFERIFGDLASGKKYHRFTGVGIGGFDLTVTPKAIAEMKLMVAGSGSVLDTAIVSGATYTTATTTSPFDAFTGTITEGGSGIAVVTEVQLKLDNKLEARLVVGSNKSLEHSIGRSNITGSMTLYFENSTQLEKFVNETESSLAFTLLDAAGNSYSFSIARLKYTGGGTPEVSSEGPVTIQMPFQALLDSATSSNIVITRIPA